MSSVENPRRAGVRAASAINVLAGILLLTIMLLTVADVVSRNLRDASILGTIDITTLLLVAVAFLGLASAEIEGRHVSVELFEARLAERSRVVLSLVRIALLVLLGAIVLWGLNEVLQSSIDRSETTNGILRLPTWPAKLLLLISFAAFFVAAVSKEFLYSRDVRSDHEGETR